MLKAFLALFFVAIVASTSIDPALKATLKSKPTANVFISFNVGTASVLNSFTQTNFETRTDRLTALSAVLQEHAASTQQHVLQFLNAETFLDFKSFWINNQVFVRDADLALLEKLATFPEIAEIVEEEFFQM